MDCTAETTFQSIQHCTKMVCIKRCVEVNANSFLTSLGPLALAYCHKQHSRISASGEQCFGSCVCVDKDGWDSVAKKCLFYKLLQRERYCYTTSVVVLEQSSLGSVHLGSLCSVDCIHVQA
ncbi:TPA: hypothetical protein ACH3X1_004068 [Trebouxia sp. C0004]